MYTATLLLALSAACFAAPQGSGIGGSITGPIQVTYVQGSDVKTTAYDFEDLDFDLGGNTEFPGIPSALGAGNLDGKIGRGSIRVKTTIDGKTEDVKYDFNNFSFKVASKVAGSVDGSLSGPIAVTVLKDGNLETTTYDFNVLKYVASLN